MANTFTKIYLQFVFAVKNRDSLIMPEWKEYLYRNITGIVQNRGHKLLAINGVSNHVHIFVGYEITQLIPDLMRDVKSASSLWINQSNIIRGKFAWQEGYGVFSYGYSQIDNVIQYIMHQEDHHQKTTFAAEYSSFLEKFHIPFEEQYILRDI